MPFSYPANGRRPVGSQSSRRPTAADVRQADDFSCGFELTEGDAIVAGVDAAGGGGADQASVECDFRALDGGRIAGGLGDLI
jgi:hypothetical protein